jgi:hypothetical protein
MSTDPIPGGWTRRGWSWALHLMSLTTLAWITTSGCWMDHSTPPHLMPMNY